MFLLRGSLVLAMIFFRLIQARNALPRPPISFIGTLSPSHRQFQSRLFSSSYSLELSVPTAEDMEDLGAIVSMGTGPGDVLLLGGDLGAGKTCFSRGFVRAKTGDFEQKVTSPTYLLSNTYNAGNVLIHHMDLYRLSGEEKDLEPLDMDNVLTNCISLIEWPSRLGNMTPDTRLDISFTIQDCGSSEVSDTGEDAQDVPRRVTLEAHGNTWAKRLQRLVDEGYVDDLLLLDE